MWHSLFRAYNHLPVTPSIPIPDMFLERTLAGWYNLGMMDQLERDQVAGPAVSEDPADRPQQVMKCGRISVLGVALVYLLVSLALLPGFLHAINADGISYISIARRYLGGDWHGAINAYWGPLFSWLLVPFLALGLDALLAGKLLSIVIGLVTIPGLYVLAARCHLSERLRMVVMVSLLPALWLFTFQTLTPDFLIVCVLVWYFGVIFGPGYLNGIRAAVVVGVLGGLAYFSKAYGFYFFIAHLSLMTILLWLGAGVVAGRRRAVLRAYGVALVVFALFSSGWIAALSVKYGHFIVSTSGCNNNALSALGARDPLSLSCRSFRAPSDASAISMWDDPSVLVVPNCTSFPSSVVMRHEGHAIMRNLMLMAGLIQRYFPLAAVIMVGSMVYCVRRRLGCLRLGGEALLLSTLLLYLAGYMLLFVEYRYLYICLILLVLLGARVIRYLEAWGVLVGRWRGAACVILALSIGVPSALQTRVLHGKVEGVAVYELSMRLARQTRLVGNIASNKNWHQTLFIAYYLGLRYFDIKGATPDDEILPALARLGVNAYFVWEDTAEEHARFKNFPELTGGTIDGLRIYDLGGQSR